MQNVHGFHHVALKAQGKAAFEKTLSFYRDVLELPVARTWGEGDTQGALLSCGDGYMELFATGCDLPQSGSIRHVALKVRNVDALVERIRKAGYAITMEPKDITIPSAPPVEARIAFCIGPCNEELELFCEK